MLMGLDFVLLEDESDLLLLLSAFLTLANIAMKDARLEIAAGESV